MASEALAPRKDQVALTKLQQDSAIVEDATTQLVKSLIRLDHAVNTSESSRNVTARITESMLHTAHVLEKLCFEMITILNEL